MKKALFVVMALVMVLFCALPAFAYPDVDEVDLLTYWTVVNYNGSYYLYTSSSAIYVIIDGSNPKLMLNGTWKYYYNTGSGWGSATSGTGVIGVINPVTYPIVASNTNVLWSGGENDGNVFFSPPVPSPWEIPSSTLTQIQGLPSTILTDSSQILPIGLALLAALLGVSLIGSILRRTVFS